MVVSDLKSPIDFGHKISTGSLKGLANVQRTDCFLTNDRLSAKTQIRQMCSTIPWKPSNKNFFLFRSIPMYGFCSDNLSPKSSRHRDLPESIEAKTLPLRHTRKCFTQHFSKRERASRLENIRRLRTDFDGQSSNTLCQRRLRRSTKTSFLRTGFNNHRFMPVTISMGKVSQTQSRSKGAHTNGPKRLYTLFYSYYRRKSTRCKYSRRTGFRDRFILHNGSRLHRLRSSFLVHSKSFIKSQKQFRLPSPSVLQSRQNHRPAMRPDYKAQRLLCVAGLSCYSSPNQLLRYRDREKIRILNKQLYNASFDNCLTLQVPLADRNLLQMNQAISTYQNLFRDYRERSEDSNLDCHQCLRSRSDYQEGTRNRVEFRRNLANSQHRTFRESSYLCKYL